MEIDETRMIADVRIHVERVIGISTLFYLESEYRDCIKSGRDKIGIS